MALRRSLHRYPELRFSEHATAGVVADLLRSAGLRVRTGIAGTGVIAELPGNASGPHVAVRADLDALPISDEKRVAYASQVAGVAHACGHDVHVAVACGVAERLASSELPRGPVTFIFQPAEEIPYGQQSGARAMLAAGALDPSVQLILGLHCWPGLAVGSLGIDKRIAMAAKLSFAIEIFGKSSHAAMRESGRDALLAGSRLVDSLHRKMASILKSDVERFAFNIGTFESGSSQSIVPGKALLTGTIRCADDEFLTELQSVIHAEADLIRAGSAVRTEVRWANEMPAVVNDARLVAWAAERLDACEAIAAVELIDDPPMTTDDFALYAQRIPGLYLKLGVASPDGTLGHRPLHDSAFDVDEDAIEVGVAGLCTLIGALPENGSPV